MKSNHENKLLVSVPKGCERIEVTIKLLDSEIKREAEHQDSLSTLPPTNHIEELIEESIIEIIKKAVNGEYKFQNPFDKKVVLTHQQVPKAQVLRILKNHTRLVQLIPKNKNQQPIAETFKGAITSLVYRKRLTENEIKIGRSRKLCIGLADRNPTSPAFSP